MCHTASFQHTTSLLCFLLLPVACYAAFINATIDDSFGDSLTNQLPLYQPEAWNDQSCPGCKVQPDASKAFRNTYTAATYHPELGNVSISMGFEGVAIYVYFILPNRQADGVTVNTAVNFTIDGQLVGNFEHQPDLSTEDFIYDQMVFNKTDLVSGVHQLIISTSGLNISAFTNFDYAVYTKDTDFIASSPSISSTVSSKSSATATPSLSPTSQSDTSTKKSTTVIVGAAIGSILFVAIIAVLLIRRRIRKQRIPPHWPRQIVRAPTFPRIQKPWEKVLSPFVVSGHGLQRTSREAPIIGVSNEPLASGFLSAPTDLERNFRPASQTDSEIFRMREQVLAMHAQIELLRLQQQDEWTVGLSNDPPPSYAP